LFGLPGLLAAGTAGWVALWPSRRARFFRTMIRDCGREPRPAPSTPVLTGWTDNQVNCCWIGHATVLINFYGFTILTDPIFSERAGVDLGLATAGPKRHLAPAMKISELPPVDLVLLSHAHMDHLDLPSLKQLRPAAAVTARDTCDLLQETPLREAVELGWSESRTVRTARGQLRVEAFEVRHWGLRWPSKKPRGYNGYLLEREGRRLLFAGDTAFTAGFSAVRAKGPFDLAIMPIGAYNPWIASHCTPEEAVEMANLAGAQKIAPVHFESFKLSDEPMTEPLARFAGALEKEPGRIAWRQTGETVRVA